MGKPSSTRLPKKPLTKIKYHKKAKKSHNIKKMPRKTPKNDEQIRNILKNKKKHKQHLNEKMRIKMLRRSQNRRLEEFANVQKKDKIIIDTARDASIVVLDDTVDDNNINQSRNRNSTNDKVFDNNKLCSSTIHNNLNENTFVEDYDYIPLFRDSSKGNNGILPKTIQNVGDTKMNAPSCSKVVTSKKRKDMKQFKSSIPIFETNTSENNNNDAIQNIIKFLPSFDAHYMNLLNLKRQLLEKSLSKETNQMSGIKKKPINAPKVDAQNKRKRNRTKKKIKKLFDTIRNMSQENLENNSNITIDSSVDNTVLLIDDTVQECDIKASPSRKRKRSPTSIAESNKCVKTDDSVIITDEIVVEDDPACININLDEIPLPEGKDPLGSNSPKIEDVTLTNTKSKDGDVTTIPSSSQTPRKAFAPPMNCSTPLCNAANINNNNADTAENFNTDVANITKEINRDSFLTIDLTTETIPNKSSVSQTQLDTVIDLDNTQDSQDCTFVSVSNTSLSMSGDSDVTVLRNKNKSRQLNKFVNGIAKLDAAEKGRLLEMITQKIFSGCKAPEKLAKNVANRDVSRADPEPVESSYIKEVILGQKPSRNSIGSNIYNPGKDQRNKTGLRMVVIDGSNVAMEHGNGRRFSVRGLQICIDYFLKRGHVVKAFVPRFRCKSGKSTDPRALDDLERRGLVVYTPSREIQGRTITSYDDRYIVQCAAEFDGVIVSGDNYRDLLHENPRWRSVIENRLLPFTWVNNMIMFPRDPLGKYGPTLDVFLSHPKVESIVL